MRNMCVATNRVNRKLIEIANILNSFERFYGFVSDGLKVFLDGPKAKLNFTAFLKTI